MQRHLDNIELIFYYFGEHDIYINAKISSKQTIKINRLNRWTSISAPSLHIVEIDSSSQNTNCWAEKL